MIVVICRFENNYMKLTTDKCYWLVSGTGYECNCVKIEEDKIRESNKVKLLDVTIDKKLKGMLMQI